MYLQDGNKYAVLKPPSKEVKPLQSQDWNEVHESTVLYGSPELADHLSGNMYMRASVHEDKCSQAYRLADHVAQFTNEDILLALDQCCQWPLQTVAESQTLQEIVQRIDGACLKNSDSWSQPEDVLRVAFLMTLNLLKLKRPQFLGHFLDNSVGDLWRTHTVIYLFIVAAVNRSAATNQMHIVDTVLEKAATDFEVLSPTELAVIYTGLRTISCPVKLADLRQKIQNRYGFRLD